MKKDWRKPLPAEMIVGYIYTSETYPAFYCAEPCAAIVLANLTGWRPVTVQDCQTEYHVCDMLGCEFSSCYQWPIAL